MDLLARTRIVSWEGASLWVVDATPIAGRETKQTDLHAHHAIQITLALGGHFRLRAGEAEVPGEAVAVAADTGHVFEAEGLFAILFVEPESRPGRAIAASLFGSASLAAVSQKRLGDLPAQIAGVFRSAERNDEALITLGRALVEALAGGPSGERPDARVLNMIAAAKARLDETLSLADFVGEVGLSAGRLRHLFVEQTGLPFKTYLLWLRLTRALEAIVGGASLTGAAHDAGFADSAHFSRTFRRMFGVAPVALKVE